MKDRLKILVGTILLTPLLLATPATVFAVDSPDQATQEQTTQATDPQKPEAPLSAEDKAAAAAKLQERLQARKTELKTKLTVASQARIKTRCVAAQGIITNTVNRVKGLETSRTEVHTNVLNRLTSLSEKLKAKNVDTTQLDAEVVQLKTLTETFSTDLTAYKQTVSDMADMDCATDPTGFQSSLEASRTARQKAVVSSQAVKAYLTDTIKPTLQSIRTTVSGETKAEEPTTPEAESN